VQIRQLLVHHDDGKHVGAGVHLRAAHHGWSFGTAVLSFVAWTNSKATRGFFNDLYGSLRKSENVLLFAPLRYKVEAANIQ
jgi:hypothetical protein